MSYIIVIYFNINCLFDDWKYDWPKKGKYDKTQRIRPESRGQKIHWPYFDSVVEKYMSEKHKLLSDLPSVDEILNCEQGMKWLGNYPRGHVLHGVWESIDSRRKKIVDGVDIDLSEEIMTADIENMIERLSSYSLKPIINATGVVIHTNLGRSILSEKALEIVKKVSESYSNL